MDWLNILGLVIQYAPQVKQIIDEATSNDDITTKITQLSSPLASAIEGIGASLFPKAAPTLHLVAGAIATFDPNVTIWLQKSLNTLVTPAPNLTVDGIYGGQTKVAVEALQTKLGLSVDGIAGQITQAAIQVALNNAPTL